MQEGADILNRLTQALGLSSDAQIAEELGVSRSTVSSWRSRGAIPIKEYMAVAKRRDLNLHWLLLGEGEAFVGAQSPSQTDAHGATSPMEAQALAEGAALARELGLDKIAMLARRGTQRGQWQILRALARAEGGMSEAEILRARLAEKPKAAEGDILADLYVLVREGLVKVEGEGAKKRYGLGESTWLRAASPADRGQARHEAIEVLVGEVLPASDAGRGSYRIGRFQIDPARRRDFMRDLEKGVGAVTEKVATTGEGEEIVLLLGIAAKDSPSGDDTDRKIG